MNTIFAVLPPPPHCEKEAQKKYRTFLANNLPRQSVLGVVWKFCTCFPLYFVQPDGHHREYVHIHSVLSSYSIFCALSVLQHIFFPVWSRQTPQPSTRPSSTCPAPAENPALCVLQMAVTKFLIIFVCAHHPPLLKLKKVALISSKLYGTSRTEGIFHSNWRGRSFEGRFRRINRFSSLKR